MKTSGFQNGHEVRVLAKLKKESEEWVPLMRKKSEWLVYIWNAPPIVIDTRKTADKWNGTVSQVAGSQGHRIAGGRQAPHGTVSQVAGS